MRLEIIKLGSSLLIAALFLMSPANAVEPKIKKVELHDFTKLSVDVVPDLGVRFIFPFILDERNEHVPFTLNVTNPLFETTREKGRNAFIVTAPPPKGGGKIAEYLSNIYVTVAGYHVSIALKTTNNLKNYISDVSFELSGERRESFIQEEVVRRTQKIENQYATKEKLLESRVKELVLQKIVNLSESKADFQWIKEEGVLESEAGDKVILYLKEVKIIGAYHLFKYKVVNESSSPIKINDAELYVLNKGKSNQKMNSNNKIKSRLQPYEKSNGVLSVESLHLMDNQALKLLLQTDKGIVEVTW